MGKPGKGKGKGAGKGNRQWQSRGKGYAKDVYAGADEEGDYASSYRSSENSQQHDWEAYPAEEETGQPNPDPGTATANGPEQQQTPPTSQHNNHWSQSDRNVPKLSGKTAKDFRDFVRNVGFWQLDTPLPLERQGPALIRQLTGRAAELTKHLQPADVYKSNGVEVIMKELSVMEKEPDIKLEEMADKFFTLNRMPQETHDEFLSRADSVRKDLQKEDKEFSCSDGFWCLYILRRAGISPQHRAQLLVLTGGKYQPSEIYRGLRTLGPLFDREKRNYPSSDTQRSSDTQSIRSRSQYSSSSSSKPWQKRSHSVNVANQQQEETIDEEEKGEEEEENDPDAFHQDDDSEDSQDPNMPPELEQEMIEALAAFQNAKTRMSTAKKARGFFKSGSSKGSSKGSAPANKQNEGALKNLKKNTKCHDCDQTGHWAGDPECKKPKRPPFKRKDKATEMVELLSDIEEVQAMTTEIEPARSSKVDLWDDRTIGRKSSRPPSERTQRGTRGGKNYSARHSTEFYVGTAALDALAQSGEVSLTDTAGAAILDSGCQKVVCGHLWLEDHVSKMALRGKDLCLKIKPELKRFRFGNQGILISSYSITFDIFVFGRKGRLTTSIVQGSTPLLLSRTAMKELKISTHFGSETLSCDDLKIPQIKRSRRAELDTSFCRLEILMAWKSREFMESQLFKEQKSVS